jgi:uncharacterized protein YhjY with autotransporter beta-barrel domain
MSPHRPRALRRHLLSTAGAAVALSCLATYPAAAQVNSINVSGGTLVNQGLQGVGTLSASLRDKYGETFGSMSSLTFDAKNWRKVGSSYSGTMYALPDRGYNVTGTTDYSTRFNTVSLSFTPYTGTATTSTGQISMSLVDTTLFTEANGTNLSGVDPTTGSARPRAATSSFPVLPQAFNGKISLDPEGIVRMGDGSFWVSDEYGPYIYRFSSQGVLLSAIRPPEALIPKRNGVDDFSSASPTTGQPSPSPTNPTTGRQNNQGLEGLALSPDRKRLSALLQSATRQDGGTGGTASTRHNTRLLTYDISNSSSPTLVSHYVVQLPRYTSGSATLVAAQSEMLALNDKQFLVLSRDGNGYGTSSATSLYRSIDFIDISNATNLVGTAYEGTTAVAPSGVLVAAVTPVTTTQFVDLNNNAQLAKFGLHNGAPNNATNLSEKWEAMGLLPALEAAAPDDFFLFVGNDNDFRTTNGYQVGAAYNDGVNVDTMLLAYRVTLPTYVDPVAVESLYETALPLAHGMALGAVAQADAQARTLDSHVDALRFSRLGFGGSAPYNAFIAGDLSYAQVDNDGGVGRPRNNDGVLMVGGEMKVGDGVTVGLALGGARSDLSLKGVGNADMTSFSVNPFAAVTYGDFFGSVSAAYAWNRYDDITRDTGAYGLTARGDTTGRTLGVGFNAGYELGSGDWSYGPMIGARYTHVSIDAYTERDAIHLNAAMPSRSINSWSALLGGQVARKFTTDSAVIIPNARLGWEWKKTDGADNLSATLANRTGSSMATSSRNFNNENESGVRAGVGVAVSVGAFTWQAGYDGKFGVDVHNHSLITSLGYAF